MSTTSGNPTECRNCGTRLVGAFCAHCGQKAVHLNPSLHEFLQDLFQELVPVDGRILQSVRLLLKKPGLLSREYFAGRRARYMSPILLYLAFSLLYFAISALAPIGGWQVSCTSCVPERRAIVELHLTEAINVWVPRTFFILVPLFATLIALAARRSSRNYPQHLYFAMHVHAAWFLAASIAALSGFIPYAPLRRGFSAALVTYAGIYLILAFRRAYDATWRTAIVRGSLVGFTYFLLTIAAVAIVVVPVLLRESGGG